MIRNANGMNIVGFWIPCNLRQEKILSLSRGTKEQLVISGRFAAIASIVIILRNVVGHVASAIQRNEPEEIVSVDDNEKHSSTNNNDHSNKHSAMRLLQRQRPERQALLRLLPFLRAIET